MSMPDTRVWRVLQKRLLSKFYKLQVVEALKPKNKRMPYKSSYEFQEKLEKVDVPARPFAVTKPATSHLNRYDVRVWGSRSPHQFIQQE